MTPHEQLIANLEAVDPMGSGTPEQCVADRATILRSVAALRTLEAEKAQAEQALAYWKTCANCGQPMDAPGLCSVAQHEWQKGQEQMLDETLTRAEKAESALASAQQQIADLTTKTPSESAMGVQEFALELRQAADSVERATVYVGIDEEELRRAARMLDDYALLLTLLPPTPATDAPR